MEQNYDFGVDTWAVGWVIGEILKMVNSSKMNCKKGALFPGYCCYPLSPADKDQSEVNGFPLNNDDQLYYIFEILGSPDPTKDLHFLSDQEAIKYATSLPRHEKKTLAEHYPTVDRVTLDLLERMLTIDPTKRISIEECLKHPFFGDVIEKGHELKNLKPINIHFEDELQHDLVEEKMRSLFLGEFKIANAETE